MPDALWVLSLCLQIMLSPKLPYLPHRPTIVPPAQWRLHTPAGILELTEVDTTILAVIQLATWQVPVGKASPGFAWGPLRPHALSSICTYKVPSV